MYIACMYVYMYVYRGVAPQNKLRNMLMTNEALH